MPKDAKKKQVTVNTVTLDTGWFSYYQMRDTQIAHIVGVNIDSTIKNSEKLWLPLLGQMETITRKEGFLQLFHIDYMRSATAQFFLDKGWKSILTEKSDLNKENGTYHLFKDISREKVSYLPFKTLYGDDVKEKVKQIVQESHLGKKEEIDKELEPNVPFVGPARPRWDPAPDQLDELNTLEQTRVNPIPDGLRNDNTRWLIDDPVFRPRVDVAQENLGARVQRQIQEMEQRLRAQGMQPAVFRDETEPRF